LAFLYFRNLLPLAGPFEARACLGFPTLLQPVHFFALTWLTSAVVVQLGLVKMQNLLAAAGCHCQRLARQDLDGGRNHPVHGTYGRRSLPVAVIVVFEIFEHIADIQKRVSIQADVHECGLHPGEDPRDFSFVDAADERELFLTLNVDLD
jgi:hypothetical protein